MYKERQKIFDKIGYTHFDICIIGGGATGAGAALDAASRGYNVLLVEKDDFGAATSGKSTKLIHGGVRYLEQAVKKFSFGQYRMVRKALQERKTLLKIAPHITRPLSLITPCRTWFEGVYYYIGLKLYDLLSGRSQIGKSALLSKKQAIQQLPTLKHRHLYTAVRYYDGQLDDQRFNWALVQTAIEHGAVCLNHASVQKFQHGANGKIAAALIEDRISGLSVTAKATCFINATGPFADSIRLMANSSLEKRIRVSRGVHIMLPFRMMPSASALLIPKTKDGRLIFAIPYNQHVLVGTTEDETFLSEKEFGPTAAEVHYLLEHINEYLDVEAEPEDVVAGFGGLRPLVKKAGGQTKDLVRDHEVETDVTSGLISILGGKWTTYRLMAMDVIDAAAKMLDTKKSSRTHNIILAGSKQLDQNTTNAVQKHGIFERDIVHHLVSKYGDRSELIASIAVHNPQLNHRIIPDLPFSYCELQYVIESEMAFTVKDVISQRWGLQLTDWKRALQLVDPVGRFMQQYYDWNKAQQDEYIHGYKNALQEMIAAAAK